jgi:hypothetical protein
MSNLTTVDEAINKIALSWRKTTQAIIETAMVLQSYKKDQNWAQIQAKLDSDNIIKFSVQKFLLGIGSNPVLIKVENYQKLPPHYNTLYHLSTIKTDKLEKLITDETVNVSTDLSDAKDLAIKYSSKKKKINISNKSPKVIFTITFNSPRGVKNKVSNVFDQLIDEFGEEAVKMKIEI